MNSSVEYKKAYVELYEIIKRLSKEDYEKIPKTFINNLYENMDKNYKFNIDDSNDIFNQEYKKETKALLVEVYQKYFATEEEKSFWEKYNKICYDMIEDKKREEYNPDDLFKNAKKEVTEDNNVSLVEYKKETLWGKLKKMVLKIFHVKL